MFPQVQRMGVLGIFRAGRDQKACQYACDSRVNARLIESIPGQYAAQNIGQRMMNILQEKSAISMSTARPAPSAVQWSCVL